MVVTCPSCRRRFKLPVGKVRSRQAKLKCSKCQSVFVLDLAAAAAATDGSATPQERRAIADAPSRPDIAVSPRSALLSAAAAAVVRPRQESEVPTRPHAPVSPRPAGIGPGGALEAGLRPSPAPAPRKPEPASTHGYEAFAEIPAMDAEHAEALGRARSAADVREEERLLASAVEEAVGKAASLPSPEPPPDAGPDIHVDVDLDETPAPAMGVASYVQMPVERVAAEETEAAPGPPATEAAEAQAAPAPRPTEGRPRVASMNEDALGLFGGGRPTAVTSAGGGRAAGVAGSQPSMVAGEYVLDLIDEEPAPSRYRPLGYFSVTLLLLVVAFFAFVIGRNNWKIDFDHFGSQVRRAFGLAPAVASDESCLVAAPRVPSVLATETGRVVVVRGTIQNACGRSISGVAFKCRIDGPGGPWFDDAKPLKDAGASSISEAGLAGTSPGEILSTISAAENQSGVVLPASTHEFWCVFPDAAGTSGQAASFRPSVEVTVP